MLFPTLEFGLFFLAVFTGAWATRRLPRLRLTLLIAASYVFYGWWDWRFTLLLAGSSVANWAFGGAIAAAADPAARRRLLAAAVGFNLALLGCFKYLGFFADSVNAGLYTLGLPAAVPYLDVALPVGISFFTFHGISYVVDLYRGRLATAASLPQMLLYIAFFPQLVAGPIVRAAHFLPQLAGTPDPDDIRATRAFLLILGGLFKKVVIANELATGLVDPVFHDPTRYGAADLLLAAYGYAVQIYCDFSAYTDIAIGVAALLGYRFPENFDQPYRAAGLRDFWRRWHLSLSTWLRDYLYIPLGGNAGGWKRYRNLMATMLLGGLWHGAAWNFVIWGGLHGAALAAEHAWRRPAAAPAGRLRRGLAIVATFHFVCLTWIFFRATDPATALDYLAGFARFDDPATLASPLMLTLLALPLAAQFLPADRMARLERLAVRLPLPAQGAVLGAGIVAIDALGPEGVAPFIYFRF